MFINRMRNIIRAIGRDARIVRTHEPVMRHYDSYDLGVVEKGFGARVGPEVDDVGLERIMAAYNLAAERAEAVPAQFKVSNEWLPIYREKFGQVIDALRARNGAALRKMYRNFFREPLSTGLHGMPTNMEKTYFSGSIGDTAKKVYLIDGIWRFELWQKLMPGKDIGVLVRPDIGNPYGIEFAGRFLTPGVEYQHYYADMALSLTQKERPTILELGGGYGGFAYFVSNLSPGSRYIGIDLPEVLALATFYLMAAFPEKRFVLFGEGNEADRQAADFLMLPNFAISDVAAGEVDLVFNSYSLAEMSAETVRAYVAEFARIAAPWLVHVNHVQHAVLGADAFGLENAGYELLRRSKALWNLGRQLDMDECEFVYRYAA